MISSTPLLQTPSIPVQQGAQGQHLSYLTSVLSDKGTKFPLQTFVSCLLFINAAEDRKQVLLLGGPYTSHLTQLARPAEDIF